MAPAADAARRRMQNCATRVQRKAFRPAVLGCCRIDAARRRPPPLPTWDRGRLARSFFPKLRGGRAASGPTAGQGYLNAHEITAPTPYPTHPPTTHIPTPLPP